MEIEIKTLRKSFNEIIDFFEKYEIQYWLARDLVNQINKGVIIDEEVNHDIDFHILESDKDFLRNLLIQENYPIVSEKRYKIQTRGKCDNRTIEFVFLIDIDERSDTFVQSSKKIIYLSPKKLFGDKTVNINHRKIHVPFPLDEYVESCCAK